MKRLMLASSALVMAASAQAADLGPRLYTKAPVAAAVPYLWTGCYLGAHVGGGASQTRFRETGATLTGPGTTIGLAAGDTVGVNGDVRVLGGGQIGCDYQFASNWVIGVAGDFSATDLRGIANDPFFGGKNGNPATLASRTDWTASVTGRLGYAWDSMLLYGKGGAAFAHDRYSLNNFVAIAGGFCAGFTPCNSAATLDRTGYAVGGGIEWAFAPNWSALVEYNHYGFGSRRIGFANGANSTLVDIRQDIDMVKVGVNYRFGASPVVARY